MTSTGKGNFSITEAQNDDVKNWSFEEAGAITQAPTDSTNIHFNADIKRDAEFTLTGEITITSNSATVTGIGTLFAKELKVGDVIQNPSNGDRLTVSAITADTEMTIRDAEGAI